MGKITTDFTGAENATTRLARMQAIHDYWFGTSAFAIAATLGGVRTQMNGILTDTISDGEAFGSWFPKWNMMNDTEGAIAAIPDSEALFLNPVAGALWQDTGATTAADDPAEPVGRWNGDGFNLTQASAGLRPTVVKHPGTGVTNLVVNPSEATVENLNGSVENISDTTMSGFSAAIAFGDNTVQRVAYYIVPNLIASAVYTPSVFVEMNDGLAPTDADMDIVFNTGGGTMTVEQISGPLYRVSRSLALGAATSATFGIRKQTSNSARGFKISGFCVNAGSTLKPYQRVGATSGDVTEAGVETVTGIRMDQTTQKLSFTVPGSGSFTGTMILAGAGGTWAETVTLTRGTAYDLGPSTVAGSSVQSGLIAAVQGPLSDPNNKLLGFLLFDRVLSSSEIRRIARRFKAVGGKGWLVPGPNLVVNGGFDSGAVWSLGAGMTISGGVLNISTAGVESSSNSIAALIGGRLSRVELDATVTGGNISMFLGGGAAIPNFTTGSYDRLIFAGTANTLVSIDTLNAATGTADNVSVTQYTPES